MNKNIFVKNKKFNPDVSINYNKKIENRKNNKFEFKNEFMNSVSLSKDDICKKDKPVNNIDILIKQKMDERTQQQFEFNPKKNVIPSSNPNDFKEFNDLKTDQVKYEIKENKKTNDNFNNILNDLQDLGILKN